MIRAYQSLQYNWFPQGHQRKVKTYGKHEGAKLFGALDYETGKVFYQEDEAYDASAFERFLTSVLQAYPTGKIAMVLDNGRIHKAASIERFVEEQPRLEFVFLPKYSPELNPIEGLWKWLKSDVIHNVFYDKTYKVRTTVSRFKKRINQNPMEVIDRLCLRV
ncbi:IS630 family transposase [Paenibacillus rhizophilus]